MPLSEVDLIIQDIEFDFNVQHDCPFAGCTSTGKRPRVRERIKSADATESFIEHRDVPQWIINTHSLHNGHLLRRRLPRDLLTPIPVVDPGKRTEEHRTFAATYRPKQNARRTEIAQKRAAKRQKREPAYNDTVLGKRSAGVNQGGTIEADIAMTDERHCFPPSVLVAPLTIITFVLNRGSSARLQAP